MRTPVRTGLRASFLLDPDHGDGTVKGGLADLLLVLVEVGLGSHVAVVVLEDEGLGADLHAEAAQDAAVLDLDAAQTHGEGLHSETSGTNEGRRVPPRMHDASQWRGLQALSRRRMMRAWVPTRTAAHAARWPSSSPSTPSPASSSSSPAGGRTASPCSPTRATCWATSVPSRCRWPRPRWRRGRRRRTRHGAGGGARSWPRWPTASRWSSSPRSSSSRRCAAWALRPRCPARRSSP